MSNRKPGKDRGDGRDHAGLFAENNRHSVGAAGGNGGPPGNTKRLSHGLYAKKKALKRGIDGRSEMGRALYRYRMELIESLGGRDAISPQQETLIDVAARNKLFLDSIDNWLLQQPKLITRKKSLLPVLQQRKSIAEVLMKCLRDLGLERKSKQPLSLQEIIAEMHETDVNSSNDGEGKDKGQGENMPQSAVNGAGKAFSEHGKD